MTTKKGGSSGDTGEKVHPQELPESVIRAVNEIYDKMSVATEPLREAYKVWGKPLPQILDEMDDNIKAVAEAARRAWEAANAAKQAAVDATKASNDAEKRAEEARKAGIKAAEIASKAAAAAAAKAEEVARAAIAAAEAAGRKATKADKAAKSAAEAFRRASEESVSAVETTEAKNIVRNLRENEASLLHRIESIEERLSKIETSTPSEKMVVLRNISRQEAIKEIRNLFSKGQTLYYSDIAEELGLELQLVVEICEELKNNGEIETGDNTLQSR